MLRKIKGSDSGLHPRLPAERQYSKTEQKSAHKKTSDDSPYDMRAKRTTVVNIRNQTGKCLSPGSTILKVDLPERYSKIDLTETGRLTFTRQAGGASHRVFSLKQIHCKRPMRRFYSSLHKHFFPALIARRSAATPTPGGRGQYAAGAAPQAARSGGSGFHRHQPAR